MHKRAFTLIEMLVVVALIVLLISMLLPALGKARDAAHVGVCRSNLRNQGTALVQYSADNSSRLPVYDPRVATGNQISDPVLTYRVGVAPGSEDANNITVRNHGILHEDGYLTEPEVYYCPTQRGSIWQLDLYVQPWLSGGSRGHLGGTAVPGATWLVRSAYLYSPHRSSPANNRRAYQMLRSFPDDKAMMMDLLFATQLYDTVAHKDNSAWNVLHADLSVDMYQDRNVYFRIDAFPRLFWPDFEPVLETLLAGVPLPPPPPPAGP
jgi:prepilin-type N-terminal cleavage/methylation domain-containing protein